MKTGPEIASERSGMPVGVDVPETGQTHASGKISPQRITQHSRLREHNPVRERNPKVSTRYCVNARNSVGLSSSPRQWAQIGRNVMTVLAFRSRGRHRKGVPALELIASRKPATVEAPVCGNCTSINLSAHTDPGFGDYFVCEDCMTQLDTNGGRL